MLDMVVIGGGISGLAAAYTADSLGLSTIVLEKKKIAGGNIRTEARDGYYLEQGPVTFLASSDNVFDLAESAGLADQITIARPESVARFVYRNGKAHKLFTGPKSFIQSELLSFGGKLKLATEPFRIKRGEPTDRAWDFFARRFGPEAAQYMAAPFVSGVYAGDVYRLSAPAAFPLFWGFEQQKGSMIRGFTKYAKQKKRVMKETRRTPREKGVYSFKGGLGRLAEQLISSLGDKVKTSAGVENITRIEGGYRIETAADVFETKTVTMTAQAARVSEMLGDDFGDGVRALKEIPYHPVAVVHLSYKGADGDFPEGFGVLIPREEGVRTLGILYTSSMFNGRTPAGERMFTCYIGGAFDHAAVKLEDSELIEITSADVARVAGVSGKPVYGAVIRHHQAIPQYNLGHLERRAAIDKMMAENPGLYFAGNFLRGVGLNDAAGAGIRSALAAGMLIKG